MNQGKIGVVDVKLAARIQKKYPLAAQKLAQRAEQYYASPVFFGSSAFVPAEFIS